MAAKRHQGKMVDLWVRGLHGDLSRWQMAGAIPGKPEELGHSLLSCFAHKLVSGEAALQSPEMRRSYPLLGIVFCTGARRERQRPQ